jgi:YD repeat-containing protein
VRQETVYDVAGRTVMNRETDGRGELLRAEGYLYDGQGRRSHTVDEGGRVTKYEYDRQSRLSAVWYPWSEGKAGADRREAEEAGLMFSPQAGQGVRYTLSGEEVQRLREALNRGGINRGSLVGGNQLMGREEYAYDSRGNRASKTTGWGTARYEYDRENRLVSKGSIAYRYDRDGNLLSEQGALRSAVYEYDGRNRMVYSEVREAGSAERAVSGYRYDGLGRRTLAREAGGAAMRTVYNGPLCGTRGSV